MNIIAFVVEYMYFRKLEKDKGVPRMALPMCPNMVNPVLPVPSQNILLRP